MCYYHAEDFAAAAAVAYLVVSRCLRMRQVTLHRLRQPPLHLRLNVSDTCTPLL